MEPATVSSQIQSDNGGVKNELNNNPFTDATVDSLSRGLLKIYEPALLKTKQELDELTKKQSVLVDQIHNENLKLSQALNSDECNALFNLVKVYHQKLINIKKNMRLLHERSFKLKKRALKLQQYKERELYLKNLQIQQEQNLIARPGSSTR